MGSSAEGFATVQVENNHNHNLPLIHWADDSAIRGPGVAQAGCASHKTMLTGQKCPRCPVHCIMTLKILCSMTSPSTKVSLTAL